MKGLFIPGITAEMFRNACLEGIEELMNEGEIYDIDYEPEPHWIPCKERLPKYRQNVLLSGNNGTVFVGHRCKPDLVWQVTEEDGRKHWVYDPEAYTDDVDGLPKAEDCSFDEDSTYGMNMMSVTSVNYDERFEGVVAWMPLPEPFKEVEE